MNTHTASRKANLLARTTTATLLASYMTLDAIDSPDQDQRLTRVWILEELESRVDPLTTAEDAAFCDALDSTGSYIAALLIVRPQLANL